MEDLFYKWLIMCSFGIGSKYSDYNFNLYNYLTLVTTLWGLYIEFIKGNKNKCACCNCEILFNESKVITPCNHLFHIDCLLEYKDNKCPVCLSEYKIKITGVKLSNF